MRLPRFNAHANTASAWWTIFGSGGAVSVLMGSFASAVEPIARYGWGAVALTGVLVSCFIVLVASAGLVAWRWFNPLPRSEKPLSDPAVASEGEDGNALAMDALYALSERLGRAETARGDLEADVKRINKRLSEIRDDIQFVTSEMRSITGNFESSRAKLIGAIQAREAQTHLASLVADIRSYGEVLDRPRKSPDDVTDWTRWSEYFRRFRETLRGYASVAMPYLDVSETLFHVPGDKYKSQHWTFDFEGFPNNDQIHDYKTFRIIQSNFDAVREDVTEKVRAAAAL